MLECTPVALGGDLTRSLAAMATMIRMQKHTQTGELSVIIDYTSTKKI